MASAPASHPRRRRRSARCGPGTALALACCALPFPLAWPDTPPPYVALEGLAPPTWHWPYGPAAPSAPAGLAAPAPYPAYPIATGAPPVAAGDLGVQALAKMLQTRHAPEAQRAPPQQPERPLALTELSLEHRRYLVYVYARLNRIVAEQLAKSILHDNPDDKQTLLVLAGMYLEQKDGAAALHTAKEFISRYPGDSQGLYYLAAAYQLMQNARDANAILRDLKLKQFKNRKYPYVADLAGAATRAGDWYKGMLAYQEVLRRHNPGLETAQELRLDVRRVLEDIYYEHLPNVLAQGTTVLLRQGVIDRLSGRYQRHLNDANRMTFSYTHDEVKLDEAPGLRGGWYRWDQGRALLETRYNHRWRSEFWLGGSGAGPLGGGRVIRDYGDLRNVALGFWYDEPSAEGSNFEALNGRQHRLEFSVTHQLDHDWITYGRIYGRELVVADRPLGYGSGLGWNLENIVWPGPPELRLGYRANYMVFREDSTDLRLVEPIAPAGASDTDKLALLNGLALAELHRHGIYASWFDRRAGAFRYRLGAGVDYAVDRAAFAWDASLGLSLYPRKSLELRVDTIYSNNTRTADLGSDQWQLDVAVHYWF